MGLDRELQRAMLAKLAEDFPEPTKVDALCNDGTKATVNLLYLEQHGLVTNITGRYIGAPTRVHAATITAKGLDFLADDGGLSAVLGTVTVRLHADTVRELLDTRIARSDLPESDKKKLSDHLRDLPAEALKNITTRLLDAALDRLPDAIPLLQRLLGS